MNVQPNFNRLARLYRWMELFTFGPCLERCRRAFLADMAERRRALALGDGDGRFAAQLLRANADVQIDAVDFSPEMLSALVSRAGPHAGRVRVYCADARDWQPANRSYDFVVSHFFLDCLSTEEVRVLAVRLRGSVSGSAVWVISEFAIPEGWFGRLVARPVVWLLYRAFGILTGLAVRRLPNHAGALRKAGFRLAERRFWLRGLLVSEKWACQ